MSEKVEEGPPLQKHQQSKQGLGDVGSEDRKLGPTWLWPEGSREP